MTKKEIVVDKVIVMIIKDLDHLELVADSKNTDVANIKGSTGINITLPKVDLQSFIKATSLPSAVDMLFAGDVKAGQFALMNVDSGVFVSDVF
jgi:hypothetical protein